MQEGKPLAFASSLHFAHDFVCGLSLLPRPVCRDYSRFLAGEWWRLITPLFVQDGGVTGSLFNLVSLFLVGCVAERHWGSQRWLIIFFVGGIRRETRARPDAPD